MAQLRHIYRSNKLSNISQKRYSRKYNRDYLEEKASHGASLKEGFGDFDGDGDLDGIYPKQRAGVAEKPGIHINAPRRGPNMLSAFALPALGPTNLKSPTPEAGPLSLEFAMDPPQHGPTGLDSLVAASSIGPSSLNASVVAPAAGPQSLEASDKPTSGPQNLLAELPPEPMYTLISFSDYSSSNLYGNPDGRWYPKDVDDKALYLGEDAPQKYYAFPLSPEGQRFTIVPETQAYYVSDISRGAGVGNNLWEWYWYRYRPTFSQPYVVSGSAALRVKYDSGAVNPNIGTPKFSLWFAYPNVLLRDLQYNPYNRFAESEVMAIKASLEAGDDSAFAGTPGAMELSVNFDDEYTSTVAGPYPPNPN